jgi:hypothetical protein
VSGAARADLLVFDRDPQSTHLLTDVLGASPSLQKAVVAWLSDRETQFFVVGTTGGVPQQTFTLGARDLQQLQAQVLPEAIALIDEAARASATCAAVNPALTRQVAEAWSVASGRQNGGGDGGLRS